MAFDGDPSTAWNEAVEGNGIGQRIELTFERDVRVDANELMAGYFDSRYYQKNNRVRKLEIRETYQGSRWNDTSISEIAFYYQGMKIRLTLPQTGDPR